MNATILNSDGRGLLLLVLLALVVGIYLLLLNKKQKNDKTAALCKQYAVLTEETLAALSDDDLLRAVAANLLHKQQHDPHFSLALLSRGRAAVYSVWLCCHELETDDFLGLLHSPSGAYSEDAQAGFELIGAYNCASAFRAALKAVTDNADAAICETVTTVFRHAVASEQPLSLCVRYIRAHSAEFADS